MTRDEWESIVEAAISESGIKATVNISEFSQGSHFCFATVQEAETGKLIEVQANRMDAAKMQESVARQLRAEKSN